MSTTTTLPRVRVENGYAVRDLPNGDQVRVRIIRDLYPSEPERGRGMWNEGVSLVSALGGYDVPTMELDEHEGLSAVLDRIYFRDGSFYVEAADRTWVPSKSHAGQWTRIGTHGEMREYVARYLRVFWGVQYAELHRTLASTLERWQDVWVIAEGIEDGADPEGIARGTWEEWDAWAEGDVYGVRVQTRTLAAAMDAGDDEDGWLDDEDGSTVWGYYGPESARAAVACELGCDLADVPHLYELID